MGSRSAPLWFDRYLAFSSVGTLDLYLAASIVSQRAEGPRFPSETAATYTLPIGAVVTLSREAWRHVLHQDLSLLLMMNMLMIRTRGHNPGYYPYHDRYDVYYDDDHANDYYLNHYGNAHQVSYSHIGKKIW